MTNTTKDEGGPLFFGSDDPVTSLKHTKPRRINNEKAEARRRAYKEITHLPGTTLLAKQERLRRELPRTVVRGDKHYMRRRARWNRDEDLKWRKWKNRSPGTDLTKDQWWILKYTHPMVLVKKPPKLVLFRYDDEKPYVLSNLYLGIRKGVAASAFGVEVVCDCERYLAEYLSA